MTIRDKLTPRQARAIPALLANRHITDAAKQAGVTPRTLHRWLKNPLFFAELRLAESETVLIAARGLLAELLSNHATLRELRDNPKVSEAVRLRAAVELDSAALRWRQAGDLETRLTELERTVKNGNFTRKSS